MRVYEDNRLLEVHCNKCGKQLVVENEIIKEGNFSVDYLWNYFSEKDGRQHKFDLCEKCYDKMVQEFVYPVDDQDYKELL